MEKHESIYRAIQNALVGDEIVIHNNDGSIWCILKVIAKEHEEDT